MPRYDITQLCGGVVTNFYETVMAQEIKIWIGRYISRWLIILLHGWWSITSINHWWNHPIILLIRRTLYTYLNLRNFLVRLRHFLVVPVPLTVISGRSVELLDPPLSSYTNRTLCIRYKICYSWAPLILIPLEPRANGWINEGVIDIAWCARLLKLMLYDLWPCKCMRHMAVYYQRDY